MKSKIYMILGLILVFVLPKTQAQDLTFSQYHYTPFLTNPAMVGVNKDTQIMFNYRRQQLEVGESFNTPMISFMAPLKNKNRQWGGIGASFINDNAAGFLKTNGGVLSLAYNIGLGSNSNISIGLQGGYFQRKIDLSGETTLNQIVGGIFNANIDNGLGGTENLDKGYATFSGGAMWSMDDEAGEQKGFLGVSYFNFNEPDIAFVDGMDATLPTSLTVTGGYRILRTDNFSIMPNIRYITRSNDTDEINAGSWFRYHVGQKGKLQDGSIGLGLWYNTNAFVASAEFNQPGYLLALSYDFSTASDLNNVRSGGVFEITAGLKINKGGKDRDGDGVPDKSDACPDTPGVKELNGCPDKDGDGVPDSFDACPDTPGAKELSGCPDSDSDGIPDRTDACPNDKGPKELNGCPDSDGDGVADKDDACVDTPGLKELSGCPDGDGDGVADKDDLCPEVPGMKNKKGCPEDGKVEVTQMELNILEKAKYVHFKPGTAVIEVEDYSILDLVVEVMKHHPNDVLALEGHTDNVGEIEDNKKLGLERAEAVKAYLVKNGVKPNQVITSSLGEEAPKYSNDTEEGRRLNRRVEMQIVKKK